MATAPSSHLWIVACCLLNLPASPLAFLQPQLHPEPAAPAHTSSCGIMLLRGFVPTSVPPRITISKRLPGLARGSPSDPVLLPQILRPRPPQHRAFPQTPAHPAITAALGKISILLRSFIKPMSSGHALFACSVSVVCLSHRTVCPKRAATLLSSGYPPTPGC